MMGNLSRATLCVTALIAAGILVLAFLPPGPAAHAPALPVDKFNHILAFAILVCPAACAAPLHVRAVTKLALALAFGIELFQPLAGREASAADAFASLAGIFFGLFAGRRLASLLASLFRFRLARPKA